VKTISVVCQKGGVGKTTTVINIASVLASKGLKTLIIDTDPQGNVSTYLNQEKSNTEHTTTTDILDGEQKINPLKVIENLYLIPSDIDIKKHNSEKIIGGSKLKKIYKNNNINTFDIILIDTPPTMSSLVQEALSIADYYFIPSKPEFLAVEGVGQAMSFAKQTIEEVPHTNPVFLGVLLNQVDTRRASYLDFVSELKHILADKLFKTHISQLTEIADSPFYAKTVLDFNENSRARIEFEELTEELIEKVGL
jgi:chromosome partitioning protein